MGELKTLPSKPGKLVRLLGWFLRRSLIGKILWFLFAVWLIAFLCAERSFVASGLLPMRIYFPFVLMMLLSLSIVYVLYRIVRSKKVSTKWKIIWVSVFVLAIVVDVFLVKVTPWEWYSYTASWRRYETLEKIEIQSVPETAHDAIQSKICMETNAGQQLQATEEISSANLIRDKDKYRWTMTRQPNKVLQQIWLGDVETVYNVPAEESSLDFSGNNQSDVSFNIGENLWLSRNTHTATLRRLPLLDLFMVEATEPRFMKDDSGEWVQVVPLIRWNGLFFPQPEFGGVNVIHQKTIEGTGTGLERIVTYVWFDLVEMARRFMFGDGEILLPKEMKKYAFLQNQNLMPEKVSLSIANSFRFQNGYAAPLAAVHDGDTRVPVVDSGGIDEQPMTVFFKMSEVVSGGKDMLYEYIGLQPYDVTKDGLVTSIFIPSDGEKKVYVYQHDSKKDGLLGATAVPVKVRETQKMIDWQESKVTAVRPFNRKIDGTVESFWRASVVTRSKDSEGWISGASSAIPIVDLRSQRVVWVDPNNPNSWVQKIKEGQGILSVQ